eukprot:TRINITY_DN76107_c0_g1_i2.p1 TRINITY_DN76107_c0_g1~~TRINITY_DN76107_c0_g1_i2.p1  ORF type:complete len:665 (-),score=202.54 TRINITY_DN76107_c0_g1_i2:29-2023(-)
MCACTLRSLLPTTAAVEESTKAAVFQGTIATDAGIAQRCKSEPLRSSCGHPTSRGCTQAFRGASLRRCIAAAAFAWPVAADRSSLFVESLREQRHDGDRGLRRSLVDERQEIDEFEAEQLYAAPSRRRKLSSSLLEVEPLPRKPARSRRDGPLSRRKGTTTRSSRDGDAEEGEDGGPAEEGDAGRTAGKSIAEDDELSEFEEEVFTEDEGNEAHADAYSEKDEVGQEGKKTASTTPAAAASSTTTGSSSSAATTPLVSVPTSAPAEPSDPIYESEMESEIDEDEDGGVGDSSGDVLPSTLYAFTKQLTQESVAAADQMQEGLAEASRKAKVAAAKALKYAGELDDLKSAHRSVGRMVKALKRNTQAQHAAKLRELRHKLTGRSGGGGTGLAGEEARSEDEEASAVEDVGEHTGEREEEEGGQEAESMSEVDDQGEDISSAPKPSVLRSQKHIGPYNVGPRPSSAVSAASAADGLEKEDDDAEMRRQDASTTTEQDGDAEAQHDDEDDESQQEGDAGSEHDDGFTVYDEGLAAEARAGQQASSSRRPSPSSHRKLKDFTPPTQAQEEAEFRKRTGSSRRGAKLEEAGEKGAPEQESPDMVPAEEPSGEDEDEGGVAETVSEAEQPVRASKASKHKAAARSQKPDPRDRVSRRLKDGSEDDDDEVG